MVDYYNVDQILAGEEMVEAQVSQHMLPHLDQGLCRGRHCNTRPPETGTSVCVTKRELGAILKAEKALRTGLPLDRSLGRWKHLPDMGVCAAVLADANRDRLKTARNSARGHSADHQYWFSNASHAPLPGVVYDDLYVRDTWEPNVTAPLWIVSIMPEVFTS